MSGRRRASLRLRITAAATVAVFVVLGAVAFLLAGYTGRHLLSQIDAQLRSDGRVTQRFIASKEPVPDFGPTGRVVQVITDAGKVIGTNGEGEGHGALLHRPFPWAGHPHGVALTVNDPKLGRLRVWATPLRGVDGTWIVIGRSTEQLHQSTESLRVTLLVAVPLLTLTLAALIWTVVGRSLRPVETIRATVNEISEHDLSQRVTTTGRGDEVDRLASTMNEMLGRLERGSDRERRLVADASHELRSPLAAARALIQSRPDDAIEGPRHDAMALDALARLQALVDQLLDLARDDLPDPPPNRPVDLDDLVLEHADVLRRTTPLTVDTSTVSGGQVLGSTEALGRMVENLTSNAARHATASVGFSVHEADGRVDLVVLDDGPGIPPDQRDAVFERFTRLDDARDRDRAGAGLGLAIVARIVERHGGTVQVVDPPTGSGTAIQVSLPAAAS